MKKILIVEDEILIGMMLTLNIQDMGFQTYEIATCAEDAIDVVKNDPPDAIIMDISLAGKMDGIDAALIIRQFSDIPIIFFTGYRDATLIARAQSANPAAILDKLGSPEALQETLDKIFEE